MSDQGAINQDFIRQTVQDEQYYWNNIEVLCQAVLGDKKKEIYSPILQVVQEIIGDDSQSGVTKLLAIRLLGTLVNPISAQYEQYSTNTNFVSRFLKSNDLLNILFEICLYKGEVQDDNRGESMFKSEGKEIGREFLRYCLEFIRFLATTWENSKTSNGEIVQTQFSIIYQNLLQNGIKFPDKNSYFGEIKKKKSSKTQQATQQSQQPKSQRQAAGNEAGLAADKLLVECLNQVEPLLNLVNSNTAIIPAIQDKIENDQVVYLSYLQKLQESMEDAKDFETTWAFVEFFNELTQEVEKIKQDNYTKKSYTTFRKRVLEIAQQKLEKFWQPSSAQAQAPPVPEPQTQTQPEKVKQVEQSQRQQNQDTNTGGGGAGFDNWGGDFNQGFDFNAQNQGAGFDFNGQNQAGGFGFNDGFQNFNFEEQKKAEEQEEQNRLKKIQQEQQSYVQKQEEESKIQSKQPQQNNNFFDQEQQELDKQFNKGGFDQGFGGNFDHGGFGDFGNNDQGFGGFGNDMGKNDQGFGNDFGQQDQGFGNEFGTFQEKQNQNQNQKQQPNNDFDQGDFGFWDNQQQDQVRKSSQERSPNFNNNDKNQFFNNQDTIKERIPAQPNNQDFGGFGGFGDPQQSARQQGDQNQTVKISQQNNRASPQNYQNSNNFYGFEGSGDKSHSYAYKMQQNQDNRRGEFRDSFVEFSELSKSDISARDFPLRNTVINVKEVRGTLHNFQKDIFQVLQDYNVTQQIVRRFKIANLKVKSPLIESQDFQVGVISERIFDQNSSRYLIKCDLFFGNKTIYNVENFNIELEGDHTSHIYIKNDKFPEIIEPKKQYKLNSLLSYTKTPYSLINANVQGSINGNEFFFTIFIPNLLPRYVHFYEPSNNMLYFRQKWRQKRDQIIKSDQFALNKRVIRTPQYFKRYFPQFQENMSLDDFIYHNKSNTNVLNYKLRGTVELDIPSIEYMVKFIVRPNFTAVIQIIPYSGYLNTAKALIDHFVFIFGQQ